MTFFDLVIVRHAHAGKYSGPVGDEKRKLTKRGKQQCKSLAKAVKLFAVPKPELVMTSGFRRADETLEGLRLSKKTLHKTSVHFAPDGNPAAALREIRQSKVSSVWIVGHQPQLDGFLRELSHEISKSFDSLPKAALLWLRWTKAFKGDPKICCYAVPE